MKSRSASSASALVAQSRLRLVVRFFSTEPEHGFYSQRGRTGSFLNAPSCFAGQFIALVLVMCDIQNETKYFNFFLIGGFERFLSFKGAKVAYLISVNLLLVLL